jgi:signal transduction histidine kinase
MLLEYAAISEPAEMQKVRNNGGRQVRGVVLLRTLEDLPKDHPERPKVMQQLLELLEAKDSIIPTGQRLFLLEKARAQGAVINRPQQVDEQFSIVAASEELPREQNILTNLSNLPEHLAVRLEKPSAVLLYHGPQLIHRLESQLNSALRASGLHGKIGQNLVEPDALMRAPVGHFLPGWDLYAFGPDAALSIADRINRLRWLYGSAAVLGCLFIGLLASWAIRRFSSRIRDVATKQDFLSIVSHELKTPLTSIRMFVDSLADGGLEDTERTRTYLGFIRSENSRLSRLVENFLTFSRLDSGRMKFDFQPTHPAEVAGILQESVASRLLSAECQCRIQCAENLPLIYADTDSLTTALVNLVDNALKYSREPKNVTVDVTLDAAAREVIFAVADNGIGMSEETLKSLGQKFFRATRKHDPAQPQRGFGLGMNIVSAIAAEHKGRWEVTSKLGEGSCISLRLPVHAA